MSLSIRQYASVFVLILTLLVSMFAYHVDKNLETSRQLIEQSQSEQASSELSNGVNIMMELVRRSADKLSRWEEVSQQINNPSFFAYWYEVRFRKYSYDLATYTSDVMIYDADGRALDSVPGNFLPLQIIAKDIDRFRVRILDENNIVYVIPVYKEDSAELVGYLSSRMNLMPLLKSLNTFEYINRDSLRMVRGDGPYKDELQASDFEFELVRSEGLLKLEEQVRASIVGLSVAVVISTLFLFAILVVVIGLPLQRINTYINRLRMNKDGSVKVSDESEPMQITELKRVQESLTRYHNELTHNQEYLALTLDSIADAVITTNARGQIVQMNPVAEQLTGWSFDEARGQRVQKIVDLVDEQARQTLDKGLSGETSLLHDGDMVLRSRDDREHFILLSVSQMRDSVGAVRGMVLVLNDVTDQKIRDEQLQHSQKMDALGKLTGGIAHDFNNSLNVILGFSELLLRSLGGMEKETGYASQIHSAGERARNMTSKLLAFARKEAPTASEVETNQLLESQKQMLQRSLTARIELVYELEKSAWPLFIDGDQLSDAILNICINSMHAMPDGGRVTISSRNLDRTKPVGSLPDLVPGDYVVITIADTGTGMDASTRRKVFEPFFTTKGDEGTGLGLSQVYGFVQRCGGQVVIDSEVGVGTSVSMYLPRYEHGADAESGSADIAGMDKIERGHETILVVDDEPALVELASTVLSECDYKVLGATSGEEALKLLDTMTVDLMVTDVIMPEMDGYQLVEEVNRRYPAVSMMLVSGYTDEGNRLRRDNQADIRLLMKPYRTVELLEAVREILDQREQIAQARIA